MSLKSFQTRVAELEQRAGANGSGLPLPLVLVEVILNTGDDSDGKWYTLNMAGDVISEAELDKMLSEVKAGDRRRPLLIERRREAANV